MKLKKALLTVLTVSAAGMISAAENLIRNPDFDLNLKTGFPYVWNLSKNAVGEVVTGPDGKNALSLTGPDDGKLYYWTQFGKDVIRVQAGKAYQLKGKFNAASGTETMVYLECGDPWKTFSFGPVTGDGKWHDFKIGNIKFEKIGKSPHLICRIKTPGSALFTGLELTELEPGDVNLLRNDDFSETVKNRLPKYWTFSKGAQVGIADEPEGRCLRLTCPEEGKTAHIMQSGLELAANKEYLLTVSCKGGAESMFRAYVETDKPEWQTKSAPWQTGNDEWQAITLRFRFSAVGSKPWLVLQVKGTGDVLFREPKILEVPVSE